MILDNWWLNEDVELGPPNDDSDGHDDHDDYLYGPFHDCWKFQFLIFWDTPGAPSCFLCIDRALTSCILISLQDSHLSIILLKL